MYKATREIKEKLALADVIIEVRDARIPFTSQAYTQVIPSSIPRIILLNKADLSDPTGLTKAMTRIASSHPHVLPFSCSSNNNIKANNEQVSSLLDTLASVPVRKRWKSLPTKVIVVGIPNVGKSSFINWLQRYCRNQWKDTPPPVEHTVDDGGIAKVGKQPGVTRTIQGFVVAHQPYIYMLDSPGVLYPRIQSWESGMKLLVTGCIRDHSVDESVAACQFLLTKLKENNNLDALSRLGIDRTEWNSFPREMMRKVAHKIGALQKEHSPQKEDLFRTSIYILKKYRQGSLGRFLLDEMKEGRDG
jgi:ribosome biogenesis GTPase A